MTPEPTSFSMLVTCSRCAHGVAHHGARGCDEPRCRCSASRASAIEAALEELRREQIESPAPFDIA